MRIDADRVERILEFVVVLGCAIHALVLAMWLTGDLAKWVK